MWSRIIIIAVLLLCSSVSGWAEGYISKASVKFGTGFINVATCWLEIPLRVCDKYRESQNPLLGVCMAPSLGILEGGTLTLGRLAGGIIDVATFAAPWPLADFEPIMEPIWKRDVVDE